MRPLARLLLAVALLATSAQAQVLKLPPPTGYVNDFAGVLDDASVIRMETMSRNFAQRVSADVAVVVLQSLQGRPIEEVGLQLGREWKVGRGQEKDGIVVILAIEDRRSRIEVSRHLEDEIPDLIAQSILASGRSEFAAGNYGKGLSQVLEMLLATIAERKGISIEGIDQRRALPAASSRPTDEGSTWPFVIFIAVFLLIMLLRGGGGRGGRRGRGGSGPFIIWGGGGGWGGGSSGGGGWSGGGGGDSWGGFGGGGDFGGGGASDSW